MEKVTVLDCTLRDGGYYCNWVFEHELVTAYLHSMATSRVDIVEIGLRSINDDKFFGPFAYCTDEFLDELDIPSSLLLGVMINAKEYLQDNRVRLDLLDRFFKDSKESKVGLVRVACHLSEVKYVQLIFSHLKAKGYKVGLNIMQVGQKNDNDIKESLSFLYSWKCIDVLYFADSLGNLDATQVKHIISTIKTVWPGPIGIHTHNNMGNALSNSLVAMNEGVAWLDGTILGMGRGAGNCCIEYLLLELSGKYIPEALFPLVIGPFKKLQEKYGWGTSLLYYLSAMYNIHPTYIQEMMNTGKANNLVLPAMKVLEKSESTSFSSAHLEKVLSSGHVDGTGVWEPLESIKGKDVLLLGAGVEVKQHKEGIEKFIQRKLPYVISLNINQYIPDDLIDSFATCHPIRILTELKNYKKLKKPLIIPKSSLNSDLLEGISERNILDFGIKVDEHKFEVFNSSCILPAPLVFAYALAIAVAGKTKKIFLAGFDGYGAKDHRFQEIEGLIKLFNKKNPNICVRAVTPSTYSIDKTTIYSPNI